MFDDLKKYVDNVVIKKLGIPYFDISVWQGHKEVYRYYAGENITGKEKLFMFSMTKPIVSVAGVQLIEKGLLSLEDRVDKFLPAFSDLTVDDNGKIRKAKTPMLIKHLFTMTSGIRRDMKGIAEFIALNPSANTLDVINYLARVPLLFDPGEKFNYGLSLDILGAVIEVVSGKSFGEYLKENIFDKLEMHDTYFSGPWNNEVIDLYDCDEQKNIFRIDKYNLLIFGDNYQSGGAGLVSTIDDYCKFAECLANGGVNKAGVRIIGEKSLLELRTEKMANLSINNEFTCVQGEDYGYGLAVRVRKKALDFGLPKGEFGWDGAAGSYLMVDPVNNISVVVGMHVMTWPNVFYGEHIKILEMIYKNLKIKA